MSADDRREEALQSTQGARMLLVAPGLAVIAGVLLWGYAGLPAFGAGISRYGSLINRVAESQRHVTNMVAAVMFDYRGADTMIEEFILFASVMGVALLLRSTTEAPERRQRNVIASDSIRIAVSALIPVLLLFGLWVAAFGYITPGGGFQGGVVASGAALLLWLADRYHTLRRLAPTVLVDAAEGLAAASYVGIGVLGMAAGSAFLFNAMPLGTAGTLASGGTIAALNWVAGIEVAAAFVLLYQEFLEEYTQVLPDGGTG